MDGAVDLHAHCGPSLIERRGDGFELALDAAEAGFDAIVLKEHYLPTAYGVPYIDRLLAERDADIDVVGSLVMNYCNGGFNPFMVEVACRHGAGVVWAPTSDARRQAEVTGVLGSKHEVKLGEEPEYDGKAGLYAIDDDGDLTDDVRLCIEKVAKHDVVLAIGHLSYDETAAMVEYCAELGHERVMIDHPSYPVTDFDLEQQEHLVEHGAVMNHVFGGISPVSAWETKDEFYEHVRAIGVDNCVVSSDMGQVGNPTPAQGLTYLGEILTGQGLSTAEYHTLVETNPKELLY
jgi:hypothetical protein